MLSAAANVRELSVRSLFPDSILICRKPISKLHEEGMVESDSDNNYFPCRSCCLIILQPCIFNSKCKTFRFNLPQDFNVNAVNSHTGYLVILLGLK